MTSKEFNEKYKEFLEEGFEDQGLSFDSPNCTLFLDDIFKELTMIPGFKYSQIKLKFGDCRFYTTLRSALESLIEQKINKILRDEKNHEK